MKRSREKIKKYLRLFLVINIVAMLAFLGILSPYLLNSDTKTKAAVLDIELLSSLSSTNDSGTSASNRWAADGHPHNTIFTISGEKLADVSVALPGTKQAILSIPTELQGKVITNGKTSINTNVTVPLGDLSFLKSTLTAMESLTTLITRITDGAFGELTGVTLHLEEVNQKLAAVHNIEKLGSANFTANSTVSANGKYIAAPIGDGLGLVLAQNLSNALMDLNKSVSALKATANNLASEVVASAINTAFTPVKQTVSAAIESALPFIQTGGEGVNQLATASVLGSTSISIPTTITSPKSLLKHLDARFVGTVVQSDSIDVDLINTANGESYIYYKALAVIVEAPTVDNVKGNSRDGYTVAGKATPGEKVIIKNGQGKEIGSGKVDDLGNYSIILPKESARAEEALTAVAQDGNGNESEPTHFKTPADKAGNAEKPSAPTVNSVEGNSTDGYTVIGISAPGTVVTVEDANGEVVGKGTNFPHGRFEVKIPAHAVSPGEKLSAFAHDAKGHKSDSTYFIVPKDLMGKIDLDNRNNLGSNKGSLPCASNAGYNDLAKYASMYGSGVPGAVDELPRTGDSKPAALIEGIIILALLGGFFLLYRYVKIE